MKEIVIKSLPKRIRKVRSLIESVGNKIGSVWFFKRSNGQLRKMSYRLHVKSPKYCPKPTGKNFLKRQAKDSDNGLLTLFDTNTIRYNKDKNKMVGRGGYKSIPLSSVVRLKINGEIYRIKS